MGESEEKSVMSAGGGCRWTFTDLPLENRGAVNTLPGSKGPENSALSAQECQLRYQIRWFGRTDLLLGTTLSTIRGTRAFHGRASFLTLVRVSSIRGGKDRGYWK